jgi:hypothetical protein
MPTSSGYESMGSTTYDRFSVNEVDIRRCSDLFRRIGDLAEAYNSGEDARSQIPAA